MCADRKLEIDEAKDLEVCAIDLVFQAPTSAEVREAKLTQPQERLDHLKVTATAETY